MGFFGFWLRQEMKREPKKGSPRSLTWPFFVQSLTFVLRSLLLNRTEMLAMQA